MLTKLRKTKRNILHSYAYLASFLRTEAFLKHSYDDYEEYVKIQHRCEPKEFTDSRLKIVSSLVYAMPKLKSWDAPDNEKAAISILDVGCRDGWTIEFLNSIGYLNVTGVELFDDYVDYCNKLNRKAVKGDIHSLAFPDSSFDFVYCRHTLEHCLDPIRAMNELLRVTKLGGSVYCSFPLEKRPNGKHTIAIPTIRDARKMLKKIDYPHKKIFVGLADKTGIIIPEAREAVVFLMKT